MEQLEYPEFSTESGYNRDAYLKQAIELTRELSRFQADLWQQVPYWALRADGFKTFDDRYEMAYRYGLWVIEDESSPPHHLAYINLDSGEIVSVTDPEVPADDQAVFSILALREQIDAEEVLKTLKLVAKYPLVNHEHIRAVQAWQDELGRELGLRDKQWLSDWFEK